MRGWLWLVLAAVSGSAARAAEITALPPPSGVGIERGVAVVRCTRTADGLYSSSTGAILDVGASRAADVLLTTAHGLPADAETVKRACRVLIRGKPQTITDVWHAGGNLAGPEDDWAVIVTKRIIGRVHRWRPARASEEWLANAVVRAAPVRLVLRYAGTVQTDCHLEPETSRSRELLAHSCVTYPGTSGSPLVMAVSSEPEPVLIGVHVGSELRWLGRKLDFVSVARPLDAEIAAAIDAAVARTAEAAVKRGR